MPAILASNVTVVLALITLVFTDIPSTRGLGIPGDRPGDRASRGAVRAAPASAVCRRRVSGRSCRAPDRSATPQRVALDRLARVEAPGRQPRGRRRAARRDGHRPVRHIRSGSIRSRSSGCSPNRRPVSRRSLTTSRPARRSRSTSSPTARPPRRVEWRASGEVEGVVRAHPAGVTDDGELKDG